MKKLFIPFLTLLATFFASSAQSQDGNADEAPVLTPSGTIPIVYINTENNEPIVSKENYLKAGIYIDPCGVEGLEAFGSEADPIALQIRGRGNSSWTDFDKKPYRLKLDKKATPLGFPKSKHFVLLAHAPTQAQIRNVTSMQLGRLIGLGWQPQNMAVEVVLNGEYIGIYSFCQNIRIDSDRIDINEQPDSNEDSATVDDGWLVEIDNTPDYPQILIPQSATLVDDGETRTARFTCKTPEELSDIQEEWIIQQMSDITRMVYSEDYTTCEWESMIDIESLAKYYIVQELVGNYDAFTGSTYMYHTAGGKWTFGPLWDCEWTFVTRDRSAQFWDERTHLLGVTAKPVWIKEMWKFNRFREEVKRQWEAFYPEKYNEIFDFVDNFYNRNRDAFARNGERWPQNNSLNIDWVYNMLKYQLKSFGEWMDYYCKRASGINSVEDEDAGIQIRTENGLVIVKADAEVAGVEISDLGGTMQRCERAGSNSWKLPSGNGLRVIRVSLSDGRNSALKVMLD